MQKTKHSSEPRVVCFVGISAKPGADGPLSALSDKTLSGRIISQVEARLRTSKCYRDFFRDNRHGAAAAHDLTMTKNFWMNEFPNLSPRTRGCVISMVTTGIDPLLRGSIHELTNTTTTVSPTATHQGKIIVLDLPAKTYHAAGVLVQLIWKQLWQQATEGRRIQAGSIPTFCFCDEAQTFVSRNDSTFLMTARSSRACVVYLTQTLPNFRSAIGKAETSALIGNLITRIHHQNICNETNVWASETIGESRSIALRVICTARNSSLRPFTTIFLPSSTTPSTIAPPFEFANEPIS